MLSALAGGGLTAAGLGGPLASGVRRSARGTVQRRRQAAAEGAAGSAQTETGESSTTSTSTETTTQPRNADDAGHHDGGRHHAKHHHDAHDHRAREHHAAGEHSDAGCDGGPDGGAQAQAEGDLEHTREPEPDADGYRYRGPKARKSRKPAKRHPAPTTSRPRRRSVAAEAGALAAVLASSEASDQALAFYRIPLFLLPIYKAAAVQYGVPWQILAAINEIETDYGSDLSVSTAGAVGWMQFMPSTWLQYGVDALNAGYADPYNPVDAIFAAARYLRAAGAATNLRAAILAYNHSEEYVESVLLRAKLISTYPKAVIATLTGLIDGRLPVTGKHVAWEPAPGRRPPSSATAGATAAHGHRATSDAGRQRRQVPLPRPRAPPARRRAPSPTAAAAAASTRAAAASQRDPCSSWN